MTDITHTPAWQKAEEAAQDAIDNWARHNLNGDDADTVAAWSDEMAEAATKFAIPVYLAALAESAEPLTEESAEFKRLLPIWCAACREDGSTIESCLLAVLNAARAPLLARIQALAETNAQHKAAHLEYYGKMLEAQRQRDAAIEALRDATKAELSNATRMRHAIVEARRHLAKGRSFWNGPCIQCDAVLEQALHADNDAGAILAASQPTPETTND